jgi:hypothetical protein
MASELERNVCLGEVCLWCAEWWLKNAKGGLEEAYGSFHSLLVHRFVLEDFTAHPSMTFCLACTQLRNRRSRIGRSLLSVEIMVARLFVLHVDSSDALYGGNGSVQQTHLSVPRSFVCQSELQIKRGESTALGESEEDPFIERYLETENLLVTS